MRLASRSYKNTLVTENCGSITLAAASGSSATNSTLLEKTKVVTSTIEAERVPKVAAQGCTFLDESRHAPAKEIKTGILQAIEDVRTEMEPYLALFEPDLKAGGYVVTFPDFGYGVTQGETEAEAMDMAQELLMLTISDYIKESKPCQRLDAAVERSSVR